MDPRVYIYGAIAAALLFGGWTVRGWYEDSVDEAIAKTQEAAMRGAAQAIARIEVKNVTIRQKVEREVIEKPVYRDCQHDAKVVDQINAALVPQ